MTFALETEEKITIQGEFSIDHDGDSIEIIFDNWTYNTMSINIMFNGPIFVKGDFVLHKEGDQLYIVGKVYEEDEVNDKEDKENEDEEDGFDENHPQTDDDASVISAISIEEELERKLDLFFVPNEEHNEEDEDANSVLTGKPSLSDSIGWQEQKRKD